MRHLRLLAPSLLSLTLLASAGCGGPDTSTSTATNSAALTAAECQAGIDALRADTAEATFIGRNAAKDEAGLVGKLDEASAKLSLAKYADAVRKLGDFETKVASLLAAGKLESSVDLIAAAGGARACILGIAP